MKRSVKVVLVVLAILVLGFGLGIGSAVLGFDAVALAGFVNNGPWQTNLAIGNEKADPYLRAAIAVHGLLALSQSETIYYTALKDSDGGLLNADCTYRIEGKAPDARWWSITAYGADELLIPNVECYSYSMNNLTPDSNGVYTVYVSKTRHSGAWLPLGDQPGFSLSLRLYNPGPSVHSNPGKVVLPQIIKEGCK
ncbi:MAG: DUF1214 domain-containing protein [Dehalococcoidia bacterium]